MGENKIVFVLQGKPDGGLRGKPRRYALVKTGDDDWLLRLMKQQPKAKPRPTSKNSHKKAQQQNTTVETPAPMLATPGTTSDIHGSHWRFEPKWDGYRVLAKVEDGAVQLRSRGGNDITQTFPELEELTNLVEPGTVLDGEVVALNSNSRPDFNLLQTRGQLSKKREIHKAAQKTPVHYMVFDILHTAEPRDLADVSYSERREILAETVREGKHVQVPVDLGDSLDDAIQISEELMLEGILAKRTDSPYRAGHRSDDWIKIKHDNHADATIIGWRQGKGSRKKTFGSLLLAIPGQDGTLSYVGRVGTGFNDIELKKLRARLDKLVRKTAPVSDVPRDDSSDVTWVTPKLQAEVRYSGFTRDGRLRHPAWRTLLQKHARSK